MPIDPDVEEVLRNLKGRTIQSALFNIAHAYARAAQSSWKALGELSDADFASPAIMCQCFAIELLLKFFIASDHPTAKSFADLSAARVNLRGHGYTTLWDRIAAVGQSDIAISCSKLLGSRIEPTQFREALEGLGPDPFVEWRYIYEARGHRSIDIPLLNRMTDALGEAAAAVRKQQASQ